MRKFIKLQTIKQNDYVYDIETETHDFICDFPLIVHNTDSFILSVNA